MHHLRFKRIVCAGIGLCALSLACPAHAAILTWDGSTGNWDTDASWLPGGTEPTALDDAIIDAGTVSVTQTGEVADQLIVADTGSAALSVQAGGSVTSIDGFIGNFATGTATVTGPGSTWANSNRFSVGRGGDGTLNIEDGGSVTSPISRIGVFTLSTGIATVTDPGSTWTNTTGLYIGGNEFGEGGTGTLNILNAGTVNVAGLFKIWSQGTLTLDGGTLNTASFDNSDGGTFNFVSGTFGLTSDNLTVGAAGQFGATLDVTAGQAYDVTNDVQILDGGTLNIQDGGSVTNNSFGNVGTSTGASGTVTVTGAGSIWTSVFGLTVGDNGGTGVLNVEAGGSVTGPHGRIASNSGSTGVATVTGAGSTWTNSITLTVGSAGGNGTLNVEAGGSVTSNSLVYIGDTGTSTTGSVTVTGAGSTLASSGSLHVGHGTFGNGGAGSLNIEAGGSVTSLSGSIGFGTASIGTATVTGAGSTWTNTGGLAVGSTGTGTLNIETGGLVTVGGTTTIGTLGTINMLGGTLDFGTISLADLDRIDGTSGSLVGTFAPLTGLTNAATLPALPNLSPLLDRSGIVMENQGLLFGEGTSGLPLTNTATGEVEVLTGERMRFTTGGNTNAGQVSLIGGQVHFTGDFTNNAAGLIIGNGTLRADAGTTNDGTMAFSATANIIGDFTNNPTGLVSLSGGTTTFFDDVVNNGEIHTNDNSFTVYFGSYSGNGDTGAGTVIMQGDLKPGSSPGAMTFAGDLSFGNLAVLEIELAGLLAGTEFDQITVAGTVSLNGTLDVSLLNAFTPNAGDSFDILDWGSLTGSFSATNLPALASGLDWDTSNLLIDGTLSVFSTTLPGDLDGDGFVGINDLNIVLGNWNQNVPPANPLADPSGDGFVGIDDLNEVLGNWNAGTPPQLPGASIPEPASLVLMLAGVPLLRRSGCRRF